MPRQTSNNSSQRRNYSNTTPTIYDRKISSTQIPSHQTVDINGPGIFNSMKQGIGLGMGSEIGHRVIGSFLGPSQTQNQNQSQHLPLEHQILYAKCIEKNDSFPEICKPFLTKDKSVWKQCMEKNNFNHLECTQ